MKILINALGIKDSGGITVFEKLLDEIEISNLFKYIIVCNNNEYILTLILKYKNKELFEFIMIETRSFLYRLYYENIIFRKIIKKEKINLVYNFSGTSQFFLNTLQITKIQNLLFYSKKLDETYHKNKEYIKWMKQVLLKRLIFHTMTKQVKYFEIQSSHVKDYMTEFINTKDKIFYIKSDIEVHEKLFLKGKEYSSKEKKSFLFIVGPHFQYLHKNLIDFTNAMLMLKNQNIDFEINITLTKEQLHNSNIWNPSLDEKTNFLGYVSKTDIQKACKNNTILISTSIIETLGLHVIEAVQNGILVLAPNELYSKQVYGKQIFTYDIFDYKSLVKVIQKITLLNNKDIKDRILRNQKYIIENENNKYKNIVEVFKKILKVENV